MLFPSVIYEVCKSYNEAFILCEVNDVGDQVAYSTIRSRISEPVDVFNER